ncbi:MAG: MogA/MoaB family molybdenum cofactor biosynthesis protein [Thermoleophilia bacterium]|nr:MogA/MoaB family molybdenum cofactor biosynthesis protein [Thermoleophilia bacterium]
MSTDVRVAVVTVSGRAATGEREDVTGPALAGAVRSTGLDVGEQRVAPDDRAVLAGLIHELAGTHDLVLLAGGVGIGPHDLTPDAVEACCERMIPGVGEVVRAASRDDIPGASLWRACAGTRGAAVVVAMPGSPGAAEDAWEAMSSFIALAVEQARGAGGAR